MPTPNASEALTRFAAGVAALGITPGATTPLALAVSGGPDSMAMLALAADAFPGAVAAATVDHGLRPESSDEAALVARHCAPLSIPHETLAIALPPGPRDNIQDWARQERYLLLSRWAVGIDAVALATAHHADDQAETFLMRAARGAGLSGLAAVRPRRDEDVPLPADNEAGGFRVAYGRLAIVRPLLDWRRSELRELATARSLPFVDDPSNVDTRFDRTRFRDWLAQAPWLDAAAIGRSAQNLAGVDADLLAVSRWLWRERVAVDDPLAPQFDVAGLPRGVRRYLARMAIDSVLMMNGGRQARLGSIEPFLDALEAGRSATQGDVLGSATGDVWTFRLAPPRRTG